MKFSFKSMWNNKCPNCQKGDLYKKPFQMSKLLDMHERCEECDFDFEPEPGFYFGSLMISYGISAWMLLIPALTLVFYFKWSVNGAMLFTIFIAAITYVKVIRGSRSLYLHLMARFAKSTWKADNSASKFDKSLF
jgi:uncharacterized protein (DUF983 family)